MPTPPSPPRASHPDPRTGSVAGRLLDAVTDLTPTLGFEPATAFTGHLDELPEDRVTELLALLHGALTYLARHTAASSAAVGITVDPGTLTLQVVDDSVGPARTPGDSRAAQLPRPRARRGVTLDLQGGPTGGTRLTWTVPLGSTPQE